MTAKQPEEYDDLGPVRPGDELDFDGVASYVRDRIEGLGGLIGVGQFTHGAANLTYLLEFDRRALVLRRPPFGHLAAGGHDMAREYSVLSRLWEHFDRAPRALLHCEDPAIMGAPFLIIEFRPGQVIWNEPPAAMRHHEELGRRVGFAVVDALAELHQLIPEGCGLGSLGRPEGFLERQLEGWANRWQAVSAYGDLPEVLDVGARLAASPPVSPRPALIHNDFKIDNCQFDPADPDRVKSVFDWDMATLGDPLVDLGGLLNHWPDLSAVSGDPPIFPAGLETLGVPPRAEVVRRYADLTGIDVADVAWYEAFSCWRTAIVLQQLYARHARGESNDARHAEGNHRAASQMRRALVLLEGSP